MSKNYSSPDFYGRQWEQRHFQELLSRQKNILITAPRRVGKTELSYKLLDWASSEGWCTAYGDVQHAKNEADFFNELAKMLEEVGISAGAVDQIKNASSALRKLMPSAKLSSGDHSIEVSLTPAAEDAFATARLCIDQLLTALAKEGKNVMLCLDEMPIFLSTLCKEADGEARAAHILHWFRKIRVAPNMRQHVRWLLCGSIGLDTFVELRGLAGSINDLKPEKLGPFEDAIAIEFLKYRAGRGVEKFKMPDEMAAEILARIGWPLPYYLSLIVEEMKAIPPSMRSPQYPTSADVETAYASLVSPDKRMQFSHWVGRLDLQFDEITKISAHLLLKACCHKPVGVAKSRLRQLMVKNRPAQDSDALERDLVSLLGTLQRDGYLHSEDGSRWAFRSFLLRDFWKNLVVY